MAKPKKGLGRGLGALLPQKKTVEQKDGKVIETTTTVLYTAPEAQEAPAAPKGDQVVELKLDEIKPNPNQPRKIFDEAALDELADSLKEHGIIQPILVQKKGAIYEIVAGERRYRAAQMAGLEKMPAIIRSYTESERAEIALIENLQREDLNVVEEARAYEEIIKMQGITQEQLAQKIGRSRSHIANILRLLRLPERVLECLSQEVISMGQARPLLSLEYGTLVQEAANFIIDNDLSAREAEQLVKKLQKDPEYLHPQPQAKPQPQTKDVFVTEAEDRLKLFFGTQVHIRSGRKKNTIEIEYYSDEDLNRILESVGGRHEDDVERKKALLRQFSTTNKLNV